MKATRMSKVIMTAIVMMMSTIEAFTFHPTNPSFSLISKTSTSLYVTRNRSDWSEDTSPRNKRPRQSQQQQRPNPKRKKDSNNNNNNYDTSKILIPPTLNTQRKSHDTIPCPHFDEGCPGCITTTQISNINILRSAQLYFSSSSVRKHTLSSPNVFNVVIPSDITQWRTQAKLAVTSKFSKWNKSGGVQLGLYKRKSHNVLPIPTCSVHHPSINKAIKILEDATAKCKIDAYQEDIGQGSLRYVQFSVERISGKVSLTLVWNAQSLKECQPGLSRLVKELKKNSNNAKMWHSIWVHCNDNLGNAIFSRSQSRWFNLDGMEFVREEIPGADPDKKEGLLYFSPMTFRQGNMDGFEIIAQHVAREVPGGSKVCEMYAGVGVLGLSALLHHGRGSGMVDEQEEEEEDAWWVDEEDDESRGSGEPLKWLRCSDENPANPRCFERSVRSMPPEITGRQAGGFKQTKHNKSRKRGGKHGNRGGQGKNALFANEGEMTIEDMMAAMLENEDALASIDYDDTDGGGGGKPTDRITYTVAAAGKAMYDGQALGADVLIVDPPRKGLDEEVLNQLCKPFDPNQDYVESPVMMGNNRSRNNMANDVTTLIYVSCGFDALARDTDRLLSADAGWKIKSATGYVLFPGSNHVETVVVFKRRGRRRIDSDW